MLTGGQLIVPRSSATSSRTSTLAQLGRAQRVVVDKDTTTIIGGAGDKTEIKGRVRMIRKEIDKTTSDYDREKLAGAAGEARRRRRGDPGRRTDRIRDEGEQGCARRRDQLDEGGCRGRHRRGRRARTAALLPTALDALAGDVQRRRAHGRADPASGARGADAPDRREFGGRRRCRRRPDARRYGNVGFDAAGNTSTCSRPASSIRPRSCAWR